MNLINLPRIFFFYSLINFLLLQLSSYKRKMAAIAEANMSSQSQGQNYSIGNNIGIGPPKEKKQKK